MRKRTKVLSLSVGLIALASCDGCEPTEPPQPPNYQLGDVTVDAPFFNEIGRHAVAVGSPTIKVNYTIQNNGGRGEAGTVTACLSNVCQDGIIPAIAANSSHSGEIALAVPGHLRGDHDLGFFWDLSQRTFPFRVELPELAGGVGVDFLETQVGLPVDIAVSVTNLAFVAQAGASRGDLCITSGGFCLEAGRQQMDVPSVDPRTTWDATVSVAIPTTVLDFPDQIVNRHFRFCANSTETLELAGHIFLCEDVAFTALPNFEASCDATALGPSQASSGTLTAGNCYPWLAAGNFPAAFFRIESPADNRLHTIEVGHSGGAALAVVSPRGHVIEGLSGDAAAGYSIRLNQGTYYLVVLGTVGMAYTIVYEH
jgi:hypothetical protein